MLDAETKRRIDNARDILVGKVPDPKTQVEQITFAMIYKFMDDMDQQSVGIGGEPSFFTNGYEQYAWSKLMDKRLGGEARLDLYVRALDQMSQNPHIPQLFRDIFKGAFLPYRDSETLNLFLKEMQGFTYEHSEDLGDAYEYLLSIFASQGKAGQFRTPRHIIDFIVDCVNPTKDDTVLDPACGTAGFLISVYKHILEAHAQNPLSPDEKQRLTENFVGYDISPDMVRLSRVNMYLHQFPNPTIHEYDTLTTEDRWDENYDVVLANPPFMTPKGGIRPHNRFAVRANRSEVLFVDYIAEHLNPGGRAGVVVPEGIIFQSGNAYKALRRMLVEEGYLYGVVSLPAGVFNPYSGVKTSILLLDKTLARRSDSILFVKISADGFDLGAQRREIERDDVPEALRLVKAFQEDPSQPLPGNDLAQIVLKSRLAENGEYNLSAERYRENEDSYSKWPMVKLGDICYVKRGTSITKNETIVGGVPVIAGGQQPAYYHKESNRSGNVITVSASGAYAGFVNYFRNPIFASDCSTIQSRDESIINTFFVYQLLKNNQDAINKLRSGMAQPHVYAKDLENLSIPLPPIETQHKIVEEIEGYQKVIDGARQVVENYKPTITFDPSWENVRLGDLCQVQSGSGFPVIEQGKDIELYPFIKVSDMNLPGNEIYINNWNNAVSEITLQKLHAKSAPPGTVIFPKIGAAIATNKKRILTIPSAYDNNVMGLIPNERIDSKFLYYFLLALNLSDWASESALPSMRQSTIENSEIPLPSLEAQKRIVEEIDETQRLVDANKQLIERMEQKIHDCIQRVWSAI